MHHKCHKRKRCTRCYPRTMKGSVFSERKHRWSYSLLISRILLLLVGTTFLVLFWSKTQMSKALSKIKIPSSSISQPPGCDYSHPAQLNYTNLVVANGLSKVFSFRFIPSEEEEEEHSQTAPTWCTPTTHRSTKNEPIETGLLYNKMPKAASSTTSGIVFRIAYKVAALTSSSSRLSSRRDPRLKCSSYEGHTEKSGIARKVFGSRDRNRSFLFSTIRDPAKRAVSRAFFNLSRKGHTNITEKDVLKFLHDSRHQEGAVSPGQGGFALAYLGMSLPAEFSVWDQDYPNKILRPDIVHETVKGIMDDYDFLILVERFDESLVVMQLLLGLETSDILYLSSKKAGSSYFFNKEKNKCTFLKKSVISPGVAKYLASDEWYAKQYGDYLLQEAVNQSLDLTIAALGKDKFDRALLKFQSLKKLANEKCADTVDFPCSSAGKPQPELAKKNCYWR